MKSLLLFIFLFAVNIAYAQNEFHFDDNACYAVIKDADGFTNIRQSSNNSSQIIGKIYNYVVFTCEPDNTNWLKVLYITPHKHKKENWIEGYVYKTHVFFLKNWKELEAKQLSDNLAIYKHDSLIVTIKKARFQPQKHKLYYHKEVPTNTMAELTKIDNKFFWGTDGTMPKEAISMVKIFINNSAIDIPATAYDDLYDPFLKSIQLIRSSPNTLYVMMTNSDGAGAYSVIWVFNNNKYSGRYIDDSLD